MREDKGRYSIAMYGVSSAVVFHSSNVFKIGPMAMHRMAKPNLETVNGTTHRRKGFKNREAANHFSRKRAMVMKICANKQKKK